MAATKTENQVKWSTANSVSVTSGSNQTSDAITLAAGDVAMSGTFKADNAGTPASGDTIDIFLLFTDGDPDADADSADEYADASHAFYVGRLDTNAVDPAVFVKPNIPALSGAFKVYAKSNAASNSITVSGQVNITNIG